MGLTAPRPYSDTAPPINYNIATGPTVAPSYAGAPGFGGFGYPYQRVTPYEGYLQGLASVTAATGQYYKDVQSARITRYQANQAGLDFARDRLKFERDYEAGKWRAYREDLAGEKRTALDNARTDPSNAEIWSGKTFNVLLKSILNSSHPTSGPNIPVPAKTMGGINFSDKTSRGNVSMVKDEGKIEWTEALGYKAFDESRDRFQKDYNAAVSSIRSGTTPNRDLMASLKKDLRSLEDDLMAETSNLSPGEYTTSRRLINQLKETVTGLGNPKLARQYAGSKKEFRTVAEVVDHCMRNGLEFGPAVAAGDEQAYSAFYYYLRNYERGVSGMARP
jgi:hypothetical protein